MREVEGESAKKTGAEGARRKKLDTLGEREEEKGGLESRELLKTFNSKAKCRPILRCNLKETSFRCNKTRLITTKLGEKLKQGGEMFTSD